MGTIEHESNLPGRAIETFGPNDFFAAYIYDAPEQFRPDVTALVGEAQRLGYPVRYWWLSDAVGPQEGPDRLIVCVHHPGRGENTGMDLYNRLTELGVKYAELEAATVEEYMGYSKPAKTAVDLMTPDGMQLYPSETTLLEASPAEARLEKSGIPYSVFYSLSGLVTVAAVNEQAASDHVFSALADVIGAARTAGLTPEQANTLGLSDAYVDIDHVHQGRPDDWELDVNTNGPNIVIVQFKISGDPTQPTSGSSTLPY